MPFHGSGLDFCVYGNGKNHEYAICLQSEKPLLNICTIHLQVKQNINPVHNTQTAQPVITELGCFLPQILFYSGIRMH